MQPTKLQDEQGNALLEFVVLVGLFVAPILSANQQLTLLNLRQVSIDALSESIARSIALGHTNQSVDRLRSQLFKDAGLDEKQLSVDVQCEPADLCSSNSKKVRVEVGYKGSRSISLQLMGESGSVLPLGLGLLGLVFALVLAFANLESQSVFDQRTTQLARLIAQEHFQDAQPADAITLRAEAQGLAKELGMSTVAISEAVVSWPDSRTLSSRVCASYIAPINLFDLGYLGKSCSIAKLRMIG